MRYLLFAALLTAACSPSGPATVDEPIEQPAEQPMDDTTPQLVTTRQQFEAAVGKLAAVTGTLRSLARTARTPALAYGELELADGTVLRLAQVHPSQGQGLIGAEVTAVGLVGLEPQTEAGSEAGPVFSLQMPFICAGRVADCPGDQP